MATGISIYWTYVHMYMSKGKMARSRPGCQGFPNRSSHSRQSSGIASVSRLASRSEGTEERAVKPTSGENLRRKIKGEVIKRDRRDRDQ
jgi:hypothetical protein